MERIIVQAAGDSPEVLERYKAALSLVDIIGGQIARSIGSAVDYDDLRSAGREGLFDAARKYDASRGIPFRAYANLRVRGAMLDGIRRQSHLPRRAYERLVALEAAMAQAETEVSSAALPGLRKLSAGDAERRMFAHLANVATAATMATSLQREGCAPVSGDEPHSPNPEEQLVQAELMDIVNRAMAEMAPDEAGVVRAYYFEGKSMNDIAEQENISKSWVSRLHAQAMGRLTRQLKAAI